MPIERSNNYDLIQNLKFCHVSGRYFGSQLNDFYQEVYHFWKAQWLNAFNEINTEFSNNSEEFCRHSDITALLYKDKVVAITLLDVFDISNSVHTDHKYFSCYPADVLKLAKDLSGGAPVFTAGYLAIDPNFRKNYQLADVILGLAVKRLSESPFKIMLTYTRNTRKTHELTYRLGAKSFQQGVKIRGEDSDFVYFDHSSMDLVRNNEAYPLIEALWQQQIADPLINYNLKNEKQFIGEYNEQPQF